MYLGSMSDPTLNLDGRFTDRGCVSLSEFSLIWTLSQMSTPLTAVGAHQQTRLVKSRQGMANILYKTPQINKGVIEGISSF